MTLPTAAELREWSDVTWEDIGDNAKFAEDSALDRLIARAAAWVWWVTGLTLDTVPVELEPIAEQAIQYATEDMAWQESGPSVEIQEDWPQIASFSAGSYSESRRSLSDNSLRKLGMIHPDPRLNTALWALLTDDRRDDWQDWIEGKTEADFNVQEVDWGLDLAPYSLEPRGRSWPPPDEVY